MRDFKFVKRRNAIGGLIATSIFVLARSGTGSTNDHGRTCNGRNTQRRRSCAPSPDIYDDVLAGYYELRRDRDGGIEIAYFGLLPEFIGRGLGGALLTSAIEDAWSPRDRSNPSRVWVHTCNRDHPQALANYQSRGMIVYKVEKETLGDGVAVTREAVSCAPTTRVRTGVPFRGPRLSGHSRRSKSPRKIFRFFEMSGFKIFRKE